MSIRFKIGLGLILSFALGVVVGGAAYRVILRHQIRGVFAERSRGFMNPFRDEILKQTPSGARPAVEALLTAHSKRMNEIDVRFRDEIDAAFKALFKDLAAHLPAENIRRIEERLQGPPPRRGGLPGPPIFKGPRPPGLPGGDPGQPGQFGPGGLGGPPGQQQGGNPPGGKPPEGPMPSGRTSPPASWTPTIKI